MKYLHPVGDSIFHLDHRLTPEVRAMLASMASRLPVGGIAARYQQIVDSVDGQEDRLTDYPLPEKVQGFFDEFVGRYGHSSIMEQVGDPAVYVEGQSWFTNWLLFDSPLVKGQEFSTRAVQKKDWPMARECVGGESTEEPLSTLGLDRRPHPGLQCLHDSWMQVFEAEVSWWKEHLTDPKNREALDIGDKEPFRPALDRARWALPGTIASGACFTSDLRERARVLRDARHMGPQYHPVWADIEAAYKTAQPGIAAQAFRSAPVNHQLPTHLAHILRPVHDPSQKPVEVFVQLSDQGSVNIPPYRRDKERSYADPILNQNAQVRVSMDCSLAVARDWHRHRTMYPWTLEVNVDTQGLLQLDRHYEPRSELGKTKLPMLLQRATTQYKLFMDRGAVQYAALCLPLGTRMRISGAGGLRDVLYSLELRKYAHGANFEYKAQATEALQQLFAAT